MAYSPARRRRRPRHHHHDSSSATGRRTRRLTVVLLALFSVHAVTATAHAPSASFSLSGSSIFQGVGDDSPLARTMKGAAGSARIAGTAGGDPYTMAAPGAEPLKLSHGTTTVALVCDGGVIAAVDSRASMGSFVGSRTTQKVIPVSQHILGTMAGGAADCTFWLRYLGMQAKVFEDRNGFQMPVATAARVLADALLGQRGKGLSVGTMIMGHDRGNRNSSGRRSVSGGNQGAGQLYYVDSDGARVKGRYFSVGSGSTYAYSVLDEGYRDGMSLEEAADLAKRAVRHATYRDAFSGLRRLLRRASAPVAPPRKPPAHSALTCRTSLRYFFLPGSYHLLVISFADLEGGFINVFVVDASGWTRLDVDDSGFLDLTQPSDATPDPIGREER